MKKNGKKHINISLDDVCPHKQMGLDAAHRLADLVEHFPGIKFSLFVPTSLRRVRESKKRHCLLDYPKFVDGLLALPSDNFEICYHGHMHCNKPHKSNNDEFRYLNTTQALNIMNESKSIFEQTKIPVRPVFRPPGFWMSKDSFAACKQFGIKVLALVHTKKHLKCYKGEDGRYQHVVYVGSQPQKKECVEMLFHSHKKAKDSFDKRTFRNLLRTLRSNQKAIRFISMEQFYGDR